MHESVPDDRLPPAYRSARRANTSRAALSREIYSSGGNRHQTWPLICANGSTCASIGSEISWSVPWIDMMLPGSASVSMTGTGVVERRNAGHALPPKVITSSGSNARSSRSRRFSYETRSAAAPKPSTLSRPIAGSVRERSADRYARVPDGHTVSPSGVRGRAKVHTNDAPVYPS